MKKNKSIAIGHGPGCPRCSTPMEIRKHRVVGEKQLRQPFYYSQWYCCLNRKCRTTLVMPEEFKVYPDIGSQDIALEVLEQEPKRESMQNETPPWE